ncbi:hypothetical protein LOAG_14604, partial [Loa loa]
DPYNHCIIVIESRSFRNIIISHYDKNDKKQCGSKNGFTTSAPSNNPQISLSSNLLPVPSHIPVSVSSIALYQLFFLCTQGTSRERERRWTYLSIPTKLLVQSQCDSHTTCDKDHVDVIRISNALLVFYANWVQMASSYICIDRILL